MKFLVVVVLMALSQSALSKVLSPIDEQEDAMLQNLVNDSPVLDKRSWQGKCSATGDPHYTTFDGKSYNFMGKCRYVMATDSCRFRGKGGKITFGSFKVIQENVACGSISCTLAADVIIHGQRIKLSRGTTSPAPQETSTYSVRVEGSYVVVRTKPAGLTVKWDRSMGLYVELDPKYRGQVCGLCGNFNGNTGDDFQMSTDGSVTGDANSFGHSWKAGGKCGVPVTPPHPCEVNPWRREEAIRDCSVITSNNFQSCRGALNVEDMYNDCLYDTCEGTTVTMKDGICESIKTASEKCKEKTGRPVSWGHLEQKCSDPSNCQRYAMVNGVRKCCHFPFEYKGTVTFYGCVPQVTAGRRPWCSTEKTVSWRNVGKCI